MAAGADWHWNRINAWLDGGTPVREWEFKEPGETTLRIAVREDATMLDALFITSNVKSIDAGLANVRKPTKKDREIQKKGFKGLAVDSHSKTATLWATLKYQ